MNRLSFIRAELSQYSGVAIVLLVISYIIALVSARDPSVGADTESYIYYYNNLAKNVFEDKFEPVFYLLASLSQSFGFSVNAFFGLIGLLNVMFMMSSLVLLVKDIDRRDIYLPLFILLCTLLLSSWFLTSVTNGLRQGLALCFIYFSAALCFKKRIFFSLLCLALAIGTHYSTALIVPFLILIGLSSKYFFSIFTVLALGYPSGLNEYFVKLLSDLSGLNIYELITSYAEAAGVSVGFDVRFYIYSLFWFFFFVACGRLIRRDSIQNYHFVVRAYALFLMPYFVFGFGAFSNRYAFIAWLFIPIVQSVIFSCLKVVYWQRFVLCLISFAISLIVFTSNFGVFI